jgi:hypothetical protein
LEELVDASGVAPAIEALLPVGVRRRQLPVRSWLVGVLLALADGRPAHLTRAHEALVSLPEADRDRLKVSEEWRSGPHLLTYRQTWTTARSVFSVLTKAVPDGQPSVPLQGLVDKLLEASVPAGVAPRSTSLAVDWTDAESFSRPPLSKSAPTADPEASWGHRRGDGPGQKDELFYGYYLSLATMAEDEGGPAVPELVRRATLTSCRADPVPAMVPVLAGLAAQGTALGDVLADSGYAHRVAGNWALPLRRAGAQLVMDLHTNDRGPRGTYSGAICCNGNLYCPATPNALLALVPLSRDASAEQAAAHDQKTTELSNYKLARISADDQDGYYRAACPAVAGKLRCPARPGSMALSHERPTVLAPPEHPPACCAQKTITVPPSVNAKTAQKHDHGSAPWRRSYARRTAAERANSTIKDPASNDISRGWCRLTGLAPLFLLISCCLVVRNLRVVDSFEARQAEQERRSASGRPPKQRRRRRETLADLVPSVPGAPP